MLTPPAYTAPAPPPSPAAIDTGNWAGYEWNGGSTADSSFVVPSMPFPNLAEQENHTVLSIWTGLGAPGDSHIAQIGIYDYWAGNKINWAGFCAWWPDTDTSCGEGISTGDRIFIRVNRSGQSYTMEMRDAGPYNVWDIKVANPAFPALGTAEAIAEDSTYPGYSFTDLSNFSDIPFGTSGDPATEVYSTAVGYAVKDSSSSFTIHRK